MKNLNKPERKLITKLLFHIAIVLIAVVTLAFYCNIRDINEFNYRSNQDSIVKVNTLRIYELDSINKTLIKKEVQYVKRIDSLQLEKSKIITTYDKKIKDINDASASQHAIWMDSILFKLDSIKN